MEFYDAISRYTNDPIGAYFEKKWHGKYIHLDIKTQFGDFTINEYLDFVVPPDKTAFVINKKHLAEWYCVDKKTLNKWVQTFISNEYYNEWKNKRKLKPNDMEIIIEHLGLYIDFSSGTKSFISNISNEKLKEILIFLEDPEND